jgi:hypothetical protein
MADHDHTTVTKLRRPSKLHFASLGIVDPTSSAITRAGVDKKARTRSRCRNIQDVSGSWRNVLLGKKPGMVSRLRNQFYNSIRRSFSCANRPIVSQLISRSDSYVGHNRSVWGFGGGSAEICLLKQNCVISCKQWFVVGEFI